MNIVKVKDLQDTKSVIESKIKNYFGDEQPKSNDVGFCSLSEQLDKINNLLSIGTDIQFDENGDIVKVENVVVKRKYTKRPKTSKII